MHAWESRKVVLTVGVFTAAVLTALAMGVDVTKVRFDHGQMRTTFLTSQRNMKTFLTKWYTIPKMVMHALPDQPAIYTCALLHPCCISLYN